MNSGVSFNAVTEGANYIFNQSVSSSKGSVSQFVVSNTPLNPEVVIGVSNFARGVLEDLHRDRFKARLISCGTISFLGVCLWSLTKKCMISISERQSIKRDEWSNLLKIAFAQLDSSYQANFQGHLGKCLMQIRKAPSLKLRVIEKEVTILMEKLHLAQEVCRLNGLLRTQQAEIDTLRTAIKEKDKKLIGKNAVITRQDGVIIDQMNTIKKLTEDLRELESRSTFMEDFLKTQFPDYST